MGPPSSHPAQRVSPSRRKHCGRCGREVTFEERKRDPGGSFVCLGCAALDSGGAERHAASSPGPVTADPAAAAAPVHQPVPVRIDTRAKSGERSVLPWLILLVGAPVLVIAMAAFVILRPDWEDNNRQALYALKAEADSLLASGKTRAAHDKYDELLKTVGDRQIEDGLLKQKLANARANKDRAWSIVGPQIERERAAERAKQEQLRRQEAERGARERQEQLRLEQERKRAEHARREQERLEAEERSRQMKRALVRAEFLKSSEYAAMRRQADQVVKALASGMVMEDSAYRGIARRTLAQRDLLAIYIKVDARLEGQDVSRQVDQIIASSNADHMLENSAVREIYKYDKAVFDLLGPWCSVLNTRYPGIAGEYASERSQVLTRLVGQNLAPSMSCAYSTGSLGVFRRLLARRGLGTKAANVTTEVTLSNLGDDSAWRIAMNNAEGNMELVLTLLALRDEPAAANIRRDARSAAALDDSALRVQSRYKQGIVDALHLMIQNP